MGGVDLDLLRDHFFNGSEINTCLDPRLESGVRRLWRLPPTGELLDSISTVATGVQTELLIEGSYSLLVEAGDTVTAAILPVTKGQPISFSSTVAFCTADGILGIQFLDGSGDDLGSPTEQSSSTVMPRTVSVTATAPMFSAYAWCYHRVPAGSGEAVFDERIIAPVATPYPFFDGDSGGCAWLGGRWWSQSQRIGEAPDLQYMTSLAGPIWDDARARSLSSAMEVF